MKEINIINFLNWFLGNLIITLLSLVIILLSGFFNQVNPKFMFGVCIVTSFISVIGMFIKKIKEIPSFSKAKEKQNADFDKACR